MQALARALSHGQPAITSFDSCFDFPYNSLDELYSTLATLPTLESVWIGTMEPLQESVSALADPESMTELLRAPSLRRVCFHHFHFDSALCQATANASGEGTAITSLEFTDCSFSAGECAVMMANGLSRNTSLTRIDVSESCDETLHNALATALPSIRLYGIFGFSATRKSVMNNCRQSFSLWEIIRGSRLY
jgi:hypothetical protein